MNEGTKSLGAGSEGKGDQGPGLLDLREEKLEVWNLGEGDGRW